MAANNALVVLHRKRYALYRYIRDRVFGGHKPIDTFEAEIMDTYVARCVLWESLLDDYSRTEELEKRREMAKLLVDYLKDTEKLLERGPLVGHVRPSRGEENKVLAPKTPAGAVVKPKPPPMSKTLKDLEAAQGGAK